ncbi:hypothetical protein H5407_07210 [Mitsuaria sp. WAJ17]|uniref:hypothetical protein n=1 Tax=Mitsuaria sp. WAJ17 TaxID=2761452 RepID=UPI0015FFC667|nr:hypothetical protein [Mitsuaria sp. WAJ17]MBB2485017.1 hypothetical protein [Mitsuaria sp. WAJ17]
MSRAAPFREGLPWGLLGLTLGISFVAQPGKFLAEQVELPQLLSVGSTLFHLSHGVQLALLLACLGMAWRPPRNRRALMLAAAALAVLAVQHLLLLPVLDARVHLHLKGMAPGSSHHHLAYVLMEIGKVTLLVALAVASGRPATAKRDNKAWSHP